MVEIIERSTAHIEHPKEEAQIESKEASQESELNLPDEAASDVERFFQLGELIREFKKEREELSDEMARVGADKMGQEKIDQYNEANRKVHTFIREQAILREKLNSQDWVIDDSGAYQVSLTESSKGTKMIEIRNASGKYSQYEGQKWRANINNQHSIPSPLRGKIVSKFIISNNGEFEKFYHEEPDTDTPYIEKEK